MEIQRTGSKSPIHVHATRNTPVHVHVKKKKKKGASKEIPGIPTAIEVSPLFCYSISPGSLILDPGIP